MILVLLAHLGGVLTIVSPCMRSPSVESGAHP